MILCRHANHKTALLPPRFTLARDFYISFRSDSKCPFTVLKRSPNGLVPYEHDPTQDQLNYPDPEDHLRDHRPVIYSKADANAMPCRGILNVGLFTLLICSASSMRSTANYPKYATEPSNFRINAAGSTPLLLTIFRVTGQSPLM